MKKGFTMIELLVATSLFAVLSGIVSGSFISIMKSQRSIVSFINANDNASFVFEQMVREIRTGSGFSVNRDADELLFTNARGIEVSYKYQDETLKKSEARGEFNNLLSNDVIVKSLKFYLLGENPGDDLPTLVTMALRLKSGESSLEGLEINLETSVTSRLLDL